MEEEKILNFQFGEIEMSDEKDIKFFRNYLKDLTIFNNMIGDYDDDGIYDIEESLKKDLVTAEKSVLENKENIEIVCSANVSDFVLNFKIKLEKPNEREKTAILFLIENLKTFVGDFDKKEITEIASYTDFDDIYFDDKIKKLFHLHFGDAEEKDYDKETNARIVYAKKLMQKQLNKILFLEGEEPAKIYLQSLITLLEKSGAQGEYILRRYKKLLLEKQSKLVKGEPGYYFKLKSMLDEIIFSSNLTFEPNTKQSINALRENFFNTEIMIRKLPQPTKQTEKKDKVVVVVKGGKGGKKDEGGKVKPKANKGEKTNSPSTSSNSQSSNGGSEKPGLSLKSGSLDHFINLQTRNRLNSFIKHSAIKEPDAPIIDKQEAIIDFSELGLNGVKIKEFKTSEIKSHNPEMTL